GAAGAAGPSRSVSGSSKGSVVERTKEPYMPPTPRAKTRTGRRQAPRYNRVVFPVPSRLRVLAVVLGATFALSACANVVHPAAAVVDGVRITDGQLRSTVPVLRFLATLQRVKCGTHGTSEAQGSACSRFALSELIQGQASRAYASAHHISVSSGEVTNAIAPLEQQFGGHAGLVRQLSTAGLSFSQLGGLVSTILTIEKVAQAVTSQVVSATELQQRYQQDRLQF